ncbi:DNA-formamidopyrimidine glycosylase [Baaleninema simplex]|uniref:DNA-formamidopyrimidine glycosylase n=1 Tax=Baaleninema simplex TaxID=2862350 RepID=UPI00034DFB84|nr:DNA-formamidopyrimidine glycosylase [Baaleninema simplex]
MPELPEVETVRRGLNAATRRYTIAGVEVLLDRTVAAPKAISDFASGLEGQAIAYWHRRGKYLLAQLGNDPELDSLQPTPHGWLGVHLRMTGQLLWCRRDDALQRHTRIRLFCQGEGESDRELRFVDTRTFGRLWWVPPHTHPAAVVTALLSLGPEPFSEDCSTDYLAEILKNRRKPIKTALLDQTIVAGVGNIYADETLFLSRIHPTRLSCELSWQDLDRLRGNLVRVLENAIEAGGTTLRDFRTVEGTNGNYGGLAWVYDRAGEPCRDCDRPIERLKLSGRSSYFCPNCQPDIRRDSN